VVDFEHDGAAFGLKRTGIVTLVGVVGMAKVVEHRDGLDDAVGGLLAESRDTGCHDGYVGGWIFPQVIVQRSNALRSEVVHCEFSKGLR
jgi:hypothetical protein